MNKRIVLLPALCTIIMLSLSCERAFSQLPVSQLLLSMPDSLCPYLDIKQRVVMLEYANQNMSDSVENIYGGHSRIVQKTDKYLRLQLTEYFTIELLSDTSSFYLIQTACAPVCSSIVKRYIANWMFVEEVLPDKQADFMMAEVKDGNIIWTDQTPLLLDDEEKKHYQL